MRHWHVSMTFEGYADGETSTAATEEFKARLGLAPAARRSEICMTGIAVREVDDVGRPMTPVYESIVVGSDVEAPSED